MSSKLKIAAAAVGVLVLAAMVFVVISNRSDVPVLGRVLAPDECPLSGRAPRSDELITRPAIAIKVENYPDAYPLSGLEDAEVVYEEVVEGGLTRFMALYHCTDSAKVGPVRSARTVDPAIVSPITRILAAAGGNAIVQRELKEAGIVTIDEGSAGGAMRRIPREGLSTEHTLYAKTRALRRIGAKRFDDLPSDDLFAFGSSEGKSQSASTVNIEFGGAATIGYEWQGGRWLRFQDGEPFVAESGDQIGVDNVLIEEHEVDLSKRIVDAAGNPSVEIADVTGSGRAVLFRDGRAVPGRWTRDSEGAPVEFQTRNGDEMVLKKGTTWIELVPSDKGEVKGSFSYE